MTAFPLIYFHLKTRVRRVGPVLSIEVGRPGISSPDMRVGAADEIVPDPIRGALPSLGSAQGHHPVQVVRQNSVPRPDRRSGVALEPGPGEPVTSLEVADPALASGSESVSASP